MTGRHVTARDLEGYVLGALDAGRIDDFEAHCAICDSCAAALSGEARLEVAFEQVARHPARGLTPRPLRAAAYGAAGLLAMAAAVAVWFSHALVTGGPAGDGTAAAMHHAMGDGAILDAKNDALDGG